MISSLSHVKLGLLAAGLILWGYGARADIEWLRWMGIALIAVAAVLRFIGRRSSRRGPDGNADGSETS